MRSSRRTGAASAAPTLKNDYEKGHFGGRLREAEHGKRRPEKSGGPTQGEKKKRAPRRREGGGARGKNQGADLRAPFFDGNTPARREQRERKKSLRDAGE